LYKIGFYNVISTRIAILREIYNSLYDLVSEPSANRSYKLYSYYWLSWHLLNFDAWVSSIQEAYFPTGIFILFSFFKKEKQYWKNFPKLRLTKPMKLSLGRVSALCIKSFQGQLLFQMYETDYKAQRTLNGCKQIPSQQSP